MLQEIEVNYADLQTELPHDLPSFKDVFLHVIYLHDSPKTYTFGEEAKESFIEYHDALNERKRSTIDNDMCGVLSKDKARVWPRFFMSLIIASRPHQVNSTTPIGYLQKLERIAWSAPHSS